MIVLLGESIEAFYETIMAHYQIQTSNLFDDDGNPRKFPRIVVDNQTSTAELRRAIAAECNLPDSDVTAVITALLGQLAEKLAEGNSVKVDGLGIFTPSLKWRDELERGKVKPGEPHLYRQRVAVDTINFKAAKELVRAVNDQTDWKLSKRLFKHSSTKYTREQRYEIAIDFLQKHTTISTRKYAEITGLRPSAAYKELKALVADPNTLIITRGEGVKKVYTMRSEE